MPLLSMTMDKDQAIVEAGRVWNTQVAPLNELKKRIRAEAEAQIKAETERRRAEAARAIHEAWELGATKTALRAVTTSNYADFDGYLALGEELAKEEG